ncbi:MAG TPA: MarR family transcriptional regulator [Phenylobacterium sp.]
MSRAGASTAAAAKGGLDADDFQAVGAFRLALRRFLAFSEAGAQGAGITSQQHQALLAVKCHRGPEPMSIGELATSLLVKNHTAVELVARLVDSGLAKREPSAADRRRILLRITAKGERLLTRITRANLEQLRTTAPVFEDLMQTLRRLDTRAAEGGG